MRRMLIVAITTACVLAGLAGAAPRPIDSGLIRVGSGVEEVTLGMTRAQVVGRLGRPVYQNAAGYMQYSKRYLFDVYVRRGNPRRADLISAAGPGFCLAGGICSMTKGSLKRLVARYGDRLKVELYPEDADDPDYVLRGRLHGRAVNTAFSHGGGQIGQVYIAFADPAEPVFGRLPRTAHATVLPASPDFQSSLRAAYCGHIVNAETCAGALFHGPLRGRQCLPLEIGGQNVCATYRLCHFGIARAEWAVALFWLPHTGAQGSAAWFRKPRGGGWHAYRELIVPRRLASSFRTQRCPV